MLAAFAGCEQAHSRLDSTTGKDNKAAESTAHGAGGSTMPKPGAATVGTGTIEERVAKLEANYARNAEALDFLNKVYANQKAQQEQQAREEPAEDAVFAVNVTGDIKAGQVDGPASAPITIIKAFDFACPFCQRAAATMDELVKTYGGKVRVVYSNFIVHEPARPAHLASCAAAKQGKYKEFKDAFWEKGFLAYQAQHDQAPLREPNIMVIAKGLGLDTAKLKADMDSPECAARMTEDQQEFAKFHVNSTPTFFINGKVINGALPIERFKTVIDEQLKIAEASGVPGADYYEKVVIAKGEKQFRSKLDPKP
jgi:protein-disulfide isomerase